MRPGPPCLINIPGHLAKNIPGPWTKETLRRSRMRSDYKASTEIIYLIYKMGLNVAMSEKIGLLELGNIVVFLKKSLFLTIISESIKHYIF